MESCGMSLIKYILFSFNLIFAISGIGIIAAGAAVIADVGEFSHFMEGKILGPPIVLIIAGIIVFAIAFLGCYGAIKENYVLLIAFAVALIIIFIIEFAVGIAAAVYKNTFSDIMKGELTNSMKNYKSHDADKMAWDNAQMKLRCCGLEFSTDWNTSGVFTDGTLPVSCCEDTKRNQCMNGDSDVYKTGCYSALKMKVESSAKVLIGVGIGIAFIEVAGIILAYCLARAIKNEGEK